MEEENITFDGLLDASQLNAASPSEAVESVADNSAPQQVGEMSLAELNQHLNKSFPSKEAALKSIADTYSFVGKRKEDIEREVLAKVSTESRTEVLAKEVEALRKDMFYKDNPQYASYRPLIEKLGANPSESVNLPEFKEVFTKASGYEENQKLRTVLESNPRIASSRDNLSKARDLAMKGGSKEAVEDLATRAVLDAYEK